MPTVPTGGLSLFVNIAILIFGAFLKFLRKMGLSIPKISVLYAVMTDKDHDSIFRRMFGYGLVTALFVLMSSTTSISVYHRMTVDSNIDLIKVNVERVITVYKSIMKEIEVFPEDEKKSEIINTDALA